MSQADDLRMKIAELQDDIEFAEEEGDDSFVDTARCRLHDYHLKLEMSEDGQFEV